MTQQEKKMKKYCKAVERRLEMPKQIRQRVMSDFISSIQSRREAGLTDEEIRTELGTPKAAAAELNNQMKEYTYRKSPWRFLFAAVAVYGAWKLLSGLWIHILLWISQVYCEIRTTFHPNETYSIGIIGGADGPTAIFLTAPEWVSWLIPGLLLVTGVLGFVWLSRRSRK